MIQTKQDIHRRNDREVKNFGQDREPDDELEHIQQSIRKMFVTVTKYVSV